MASRSASVSADAITSSGPSTWRRPTSSPSLSSVPYRPSRLSVSPPSAASALLWLWSLLRLGLLLRLLFLRLLLALPPAGPGLDPGRWRRSRLGRAHRRRRAHGRAGGWAPAAHPPHANDASLAWCAARLGCGATTAAIAWAVPELWAGLLRRRRRASNDSPFHGRTRGSRHTHSQMAKRAERRIRQLERDRRGRRLHDLCRLVHLHRATPEVTRGHSGHNQRGESQRICRQHAQRVWAARQTPAATTPGPWRHARRGSSPAPWPCRAQDRQPAAAAPGLVRGELGNPEAGCHRHLAPFAEPDPELGERTAQPLGARDGSIDVGLGQKQRELLAAEPPRDVDVAPVGPDQVGEGLEHLVAGVVAEPIVDQLEVVEVGENDGHRAVQPAARARSPPPAPRGSGAG